MKTGIADLPLDTGRCPRWLFERMKKLSRAIIIAIREEFTAEEILKRLSDPVWFQSLSCVIGMDWNSSGTTTITLGALKVGLFDVQDRLGIYVCGGKKESRKTPEEIEAYGISRGFSFAPDLIYASKMAAKVDSSLIQNPQAPFQLYQHNFIFTKQGQWAVIQQAMSPEIQKARRYHWLSSNLQQPNGKSDFIEEPHTGIVSHIKVRPLNLTAKKSDKNREISLGLVKEEPKKFLKNLDLIQTKRSKNLIEMELYDKEFYWHPVAEEKFDLKRLGKTIFFANTQNPENFEKLVSLKGIGPKTIRALSLVSELIYGAKPSYEDPARYSFTVGGKDSIPFPVNRPVYDKILEIMEKGIKKSKIAIREKVEAQKRLYKNYE